MNDIVKVGDRIQFEFNGSIHIIKIFAFKDHENEHGQPCPVDSFGSYPHHSIRYRKVKNKVVIVINDKDRSNPCKVVK